MPFGAKVLLIGAGPTGLMLAQLMKVSKLFILSSVHLFRTLLNHHRSVAPATSLSLPTQV